MKTRKLSIRMKLIIGSIVISTIVCIIMGIALSINVNGNYKNQIVKETKDVAMVAAENVNVDLLQKIKPGMEDTKDYSTIIESLRKCLVSDTMEYIYIIYKEGDNYYFWADADEKKPASIGDDCVYSENMDVAWGGTAIANTEIYKDEWGSHLTGYAPIKDKSGKVIALIAIDCSVNDIAVYMRGLYIMIGIIIAVGIIVSGLGIGVIVGNVTKNIHVIVKKLEDIVHTDGDLTQQIEMKSGDETELIANLFNEFIVIFRNIVANMREHADSIKEASIGLAGKMEEADSNMTNVAADIQNLLALMEETSASMNEITSAVEGMSTIAGNMNQAASDGMSFSNDVKDRAGDLEQKSADQKANSMDLAERITKVLEDKIAEAKAVQKIHELSENIVDISSRSNLLALNASIEAARAGEAGRGFSVVADEISNLATNTKETAETIVEVSQTSIRSVEELANAAKELVSFLREEVFSDYDFFVESGKEYFADAEKIYTCMDTFDKLAVELKDSMQSIIETTKVVDTAVSDSNKDISSVASITDNLAASMDDINKVSKDNTNRVNDMEESVRQFKTE